LEAGFDCLENRTGGRGGVARGRGGWAGVGLLFPLLFSGQGGWERNCLEGWGERNFRVHFFYNFRGGFFFHGYPYFRNNRF